MEHEDEDDCKEEVKWSTFKHFSWAPSELMQNSSCEFEIDFDNSGTLWLSVEIASNSGGVHRTCIPLHLIENYLEENFEDEEGPSYLKQKVE